MTRTARHQKKPAAWVLPNAERDLQRIERRAQRSGKPSRLWRDAPMVERRDL